MLVMRDVPNDDNDVADPVPHTDLKSEESESGERRVQLRHHRVGVPYEEGAMGRDTKHQLARAGCD